MNITILIIFLCIVILALAALAFWYRRKWKEENSRRWQETSVMLTVENEKDAQIHNLRIRNSLLNHEIEAVELKNRDLQDRLSSAFCPSNNHVWQNGVCVKCGRMKDD